jgi:hypothetical protein
MTNIGIPMIRKGKPGNCAGNGKAEMEFFNFKQFQKNEIRTIDYDFSQLF